jgi:hypothetical protein
MAPFRQEKQRQSETSTTAVHLLFIDSEGWPVVFEKSALRLLGGRFYEDDENSSIPRIFLN